MMRGVRRLAVPESSTMARSSTPPRLEGVRHPSSRGPSARWSEVLSGDYLVSPATNSHIDLDRARGRARRGHFGSVRHPVWTGCVYGYGNQ